MANRFELLNQPDILGSFETGRAQARQVQREQLADQEMRAKIDRGNQFRQLAGAAYGAGNRTNRKTAISQAAAVDPQAAMALDTQLAGNEDTKQKRLGVWARALLNVPEGPTRQMLYQQMRPEMQSFGINAPEQYSPEVGKMAQAFVDMASGAPSAQLQTFRAMTQGLPPEDAEKARRIELGLDGRATSAGMSMQKITGPDGREYAVVFDPRTGAPRPVSMQELFGGQGAPQLAAPGSPAPAAQPAAPVGTPLAGLSPAEKAAQEAQAKANVELQMQPQIARETTLAKQRAETQADREASAPKRVQGLQQIRQSVGNVISTIDELNPLINGLTTGVGGAALRGVPGTDAYNLNSKLTTIKANLGFDRLQAMRDASPTGGALGQVAVQELEGLQASVASLDPNQSEPQLRQQLARVQRHYQNWLGIVEESYRQQGVQAPAAPSAAAPVRPGTPLPAANEITATGPNGQKIVLRNGAWVPLQ